MVATMKIVEPISDKDLTYYLSTDSSAVMHRARNGVSIVERLTVELIASRAWLKAVRGAGLGGPQIDFLELDKFIDEGIYVDDDCD